MSMDAARRPTRPVDRTVGLRRRGGTTPRRRAPFIATEDEGRSSTQRLLWTMRFTTARCATPRYGSPHRPRLIVARPTPCHATDVEHRGGGGILVSQFG
jgi:hypothetical protein